jgi:hypothetical protein
MRTTVRLDDELLAQAKQIAARTNRTLTAVIEDALREMLARRQAPAESAPIKLVTVGGNGLRRGVDLDDSAALLELMEAADDPAGR